MLHSLPQDDGGIIGVIHRDAPEPTFFSEDVTEATAEILNDLDSRKIDSDTAHIRLTEFLPTPPSE